MRQRILTVYLSLLVGVIAALALPLGLSVTSREIQTVSIDRARDTARFASLAEPALRSGRLESLVGELYRYDELFGIAAVVVGGDGRVIVASRPSPVDDPNLAETIQVALSGERITTGASIWPWQRDTLLAGEPVGQGGEVIGAVVTVSRMDSLRTDIWRTWAVIAAASVVFLAIGVAAGGRLVRWILRPIHDLGGAVDELATGALRVHISDLLGPAELRRLANSFNTMSERLATLMERQRTFVSYASHQLRGPIGILRLGVDNLQPHLDASADEEFQLVRGEVDRLARICDSLLSYARAEVNTGDITNVDLHQLADARACAWENIAASTGVHIRRVSGAPAEAYTSREAIGSALDALIENAIKFAGPGSTVTIEVDTDGDDSVIRVVDDGPGMSDDDIRFAAHPFWRRADHQNVDGSGLGAAIADALVTAYGGTLSFHHATPHGLDARIRLPRRSLAAQPLAVP